jgi:serine/threonine-protein kinase
LRDFDPERRAAQARVGSVLRGKYTIDAVLGVGGMAVVYAATHRNRKRFAVKMLRQDVSKQPSVRERFLREGYVANTVDHPGAVAVLDDDADDDGTAFLVMELLEGRSVDAICDDAGGRLSVDTVASIALQLLDVLVAAHAKGVVHRDIKPANLFVTSDGQLKVLDFGIARIREVAGVIHTTHTGALFGTPAFMAPEQAAGRLREVDEQTDVWAVGATMFTLLTARLVHQADNAHALLVAAATEDAPSLALFSPQVPPEVSAVVDRALSRSKMDRWLSAAAMRDALAQARGVLSMVTLPRPPIALPERLALSLMQTVAAFPPGTATAARAEAETVAEDAVASKMTTEMSVSLPAGAPAVLPLGPPVARTSSSRRAFWSAIPLLGAILAVSAYGVLRSRAPGARLDPSASGASSADPPASAPSEIAPDSASAVAPDPSASLLPPTAPSPSASVTTTTTRGVAATRPAAVAALSNMVRSGGPLPATPPSRPSVPRPAPSSGCFYFDPALNRIVAKPGCR